MKKNAEVSLVTALTIILGMPAAASAQDTAGDLSSSDLNNLRGALQTRYDAALAATNDDRLVSANDPRYLWASDAKVQCAIALGYLKSSTRDEPSIRKCGFSYDMMMRQPRPPQPPVVVRPPEPPRPDICDNRKPGLIFFDFDVDVPGPDAVQTIRIVSANTEVCGWSRFSVVGHTDRAGSDSYNDDLSLRRARSVANLLESMGVDPAAVSVSAKGETAPREPTADGVRNPQNRRVEINVSE
jgi:outer membrane protein OmpA-like peptidoglycan-associated protein